MAPRKRCLHTGNGTISAVQVYFHATLNTEQSDDIQLTVGNWGNKTMTSYDSYGTTKRSDSNCRTCTDFKSWSKQQRQIFSKSEDNAVQKSDTDSNSDAEMPRRPDCPMDKSSLGKATWGLLHTMAAFYDRTPTDNQKKDMKSFFVALTRVYPCEYCAKDFQKDLASHPINVNSQEELAQWVCNFHNRVNVKLGKPEFDCSKVNQRWRDGWLDGSCD